MEQLHEYAWFLNWLSDHADEIKKLDPDTFKHKNDKEVIVALVQDKIIELGGTVEDYWFTP